MAEITREQADDSPERLKARREALGWTRQEAADAVSKIPSRLTGRPVPWRLNDVMITESECADEYALCRAYYAAALSAEEQRREAQPEPAPEVVDVPQPIGACPNIHDTVEATWQPGEPYVRFTNTHVPIPLLRAMLEDIDAQQRMASIKGHHARWDAQLEPTRHEPRYKVGDWVRVQHHGTVYQVGEIGDAGLGTLYYREKPGPCCTGQSWAAVALTPAIDPALRETARAIMEQMRGGPIARARARATAAEKEREG